MTVTPGNVPVGLDVTTKGTFNVYAYQEKDNSKVNGYMHSVSGQDQRNDYYVEKSTPYSERDVYLGIPFNNADQFMVNGEGIGGGFRYFQKKLGHFLPQKAHNTSVKRNLGIDMNWGVTVGVGVTIGLGDSKSQTTDWKKPGTASQYVFDQQGVFRFNGDKGGSVEYTTGGAGVRNTDLVSAGIGGNGSLELSSVGNLDHTKLSSSSYINYHTKANHGFDATQVTGLNDNVTATNATAITELKVTNKNGLNYVYGTPVFNRNVSTFQVDANLPATQKDKDHFLMYRPFALKQAGNEYEVDVDHAVHDYANAKVVGEVKPAPYATNYLLTSITTPDYVEVGNDGPDAKDFGGWTKFAYHKKYGAGTNGWYRWRVPYNGMFFQQEKISDRKGAVGTVSTGEKEVYYLKTIETKTHIAYFVTNKSNTTRWQNVQSPVTASSPYIQGSSEDRKDGLGAKHLAGKTDPAAVKGSNGAQIKGDERLEYLEKIVLFSKKQPDKPLQTVHFDYDYSLVQNVPNHDQGLFPRPKVNNASGKLTLKKVWFEYGGISNGKTSPYEFVYKYKVKNEFAAEVREDYPDIINEMSDKHGISAQNPDYAPYYLGPWGNIQLDGSKRKKQKKPWLYQGKLTDAQHKKFDPAAWQLKQIKLPSGGEILVQYEQKDYSFVQNRRPMVMTSLLEANDSKLTGKKYGLSPSYVVNVRDMGIDPTNQVEVDEQVALLKKHFVDDGEKIYFKFLYKLIGSGPPSLKDCQSEYLKGYAAVASVERVDINGEYSIKITLDGKEDDNKRASIPRQACYDFYANKRQHFDCEGTDKFDQKVYAKRDKLVNANLENGGIVNDYLSRLLLRSFSEGIPKKKKVGTQMSAELSYLRLPMIKAKRGGGVRVKRLLMYDAGIETGDANLYGQEFFYEDFIKEDGKIKKISSGVATNEPSGVRDENPLVRYLPRKGQSWYSRLTAGFDKKQFEGPIGESLLPGASVGHSKVIAQSIHKGKTGTGYSVNEYYTVKDFPYDKLYVYKTDKKDPTSNLEKGVDYTSLEANRKKRNREPPISLGLFYYENDQVWLTQGYRFILNNMHGQTKRVASYMGTYDGVDTEQSQMFAQQKYEYYQPGERIRMLHPDGTITWEVPGKEMDMTMERRSVRNRNINVELGVDLSATFIVPPLPIYVSPSMNFSYARERIGTHVISKVIRYPVIMKKVTTFQDGVTNESENLGFNPHTGGAILTRTTDGFDQVKVGTQALDGNIYSLTIPASWKYPAFGRIYESGQVQDRFNQLGLSAGSIITYGEAGNPLKTEGQWKMDQNVLSVGFQTFKNNWATNASQAVKSQYGLNDTEVIAALDKIWRPHTSYTYRDNVVSSDPKVAAGNRIYKGGVISSVTLPTTTDPNGHWSQQAPTFGNQWIKSSEVTLYSPHGNALEEKDPLGIFSSARFDQEGILPMMVAANAQHGATYFQSFEHDTYTPDGHSGRYCKTLTPGDQSLFAQGEKIIKTTQLSSKGGIVKLWLHYSYDQPTLNIKLRNFVDTSQMSSTTFSLQKVAQVGEWVLFSGEIPGSAFIYNTFDLVVSSSSSLNRILKVDDVKFQPLDAQTTCYVYDLKSLRLLTQFDDEHFGLYYQYNDQGQLTRKLIETERGLKTIQETQYNTPKKPRK
ncbi:hypothetical protein [uncultured Microscilla sp.]|uniref:hypothetical protein n=1 Tax=uncultured Microscilla sp. TaxID=432653 RepID=UPI00262672C0|nr:hypothetical protein [uncultured Microscilla sp.]